MMASAPAMVQCIPARLSRVPMATLQPASATVLRRYFVRLSFRPDRPFCGPPKLCLRMQSRIEYRPHSLSTQRKHFVRSQQVFPARTMRTMRVPLPRTPRSSRSLTPPPLEANRQSQVPPGVPIDIWEKSPWGFEPAACFPPGWILVWHPALLDWGILRDRRPYGLVPLAGLLPA